MWSLAMEPILTRLQQRYGTRLAFSNINVDDPNWMSLTDKLSVAYLPTIILVDRHRRQFKRYEGLVPEDVLTADIERMMTVK